MSPSPLRRRIPTLAGSLLPLFSFAVFLSGGPASATTVNSGIDTYVDSFDGVKDTTGSTSGVQIPDLRDTCFGAPGLACAGTNSMDGLDPAAGADNAGSGGISGDGLYGVKWDTNIGNTSSINEGLLWFDIDAQTLADFDAAPNAIATLRYNVHDNGSDASLYRMTSDWLSGPNGGNSVTWNSLGGGVMPGTNASAGSTATLIADDDDGTYTADVTADVAAWASGSATNYGWGIEADGGTRVRLNTFENGDASLRPTLILQTLIAGSSFEVPTTGTTTFAAAGGELGFTQTPTVGGNFGVVDSGDAFPTTDGDQAYEATGDAQTTQTLTFDMVDLSDSTGVSFFIDLFVSSTTWESPDFVRITLDTDDGTVMDSVVLLDVPGDPDGDPNITEGEWRQYTADLDDSLISATLKIETSNNSGSLAEKFFFDNIRFVGDLPPSASIPEPAAGLLLGIALVAGIRRHRSRSAVA